jgi:prolipoprotein diacylglyceryltransferase
LEKNRSLLDFFPSITYLYFIHLKPWPMFTIDAVHHVNWYALSYLVSHVLTFLILFYLGWKKGYPLTSWILILVSGALFFIIGTRLVTYRAAEWAELFREGAFPLTENRSAIGGLFFAILGIELSRSWLKTREYVLDTYVLVVPLGLAIQKVGCLVNGCCFGTPTSLPWGISYAQGTAVHYHHWISQSISPAGAWSLPVHPVPLYEILLYLGIFGILILISPRLKTRGAGFLLALTLLALGRFILEFPRDPAATVALGQELAGLKAMQWLMILTAITCGILLLRKLKKPPHPFPFRNNPVPMWRKFAWICLLSLVIFTIHRGCSPVEILVLNLKLLPAVILFGMQIWITYTVPRFRLAGILLLLLPLLFMGQAIPGKEGNWKVFHSFGVGGTFGSFGQEALYNEHEGGCGTTYSRNYYTHDFGMGTLNYSYIKQDGYTRVTYGGSLFGGLDMQREINFPGSTRYFSLGILPYADFNQRWIGGGIGASMGYQNYVPNAPFSERSISTGIKSFPFLPYIKLRVGPYDIIDLEYKFQDEFPTQFPVPTHQISWGSGFGMINGSGLRIGAIAPVGGFFVTGKLLLQQKFMLLAKYTYSGEFNYGNSHLFSFGLSYRLPAVQEKK